MLTAKNDTQMKIYYCLSRYPLITDNFVRFPATVRSDNSLPASVHISDHLISKYREREQKYYTDLVVNDFRTNFEKRSVFCNIIESTTCSVHNMHIIILLYIRGIHVI